MPWPYKKHLGGCTDDGDCDSSTPAPPPLRRPFEDAMDDDDTRGRNSALVEEVDVERKEMGAVREEQVQQRILRIIQVLASVTLASILVAATKDDSAFGMLLTSATAVIDTFDWGSPSKLDPPSSTAALAPAAAAAALAAAAPPPPPPLPPQLPQQLPPRPCRCRRGHRHR